MSKISDELRVFANTYYPKGHHEAYDALFALANRIDAEMAELPKGKDGRPILVGETVYGEDGKAWHVRGVTIGEKSIANPGHGIRATSDANEWRYLKPEWLTHKRPDSWSCIAQELEDMSENFRATDKESFSALLDFADRIRRLAEREASNGTD